MACFLCILCVPWALLYEFIIISKIRKKKLPRTIWQHGGVPRRPTHLVSLGALVAKTEKTIIDNFLDLPYD